MKTNSILSCLDEQSTLSEIKLLLGADTDKKNTVMLVEGEDDVKLFRFLVSPFVTIIKAYGASTSIDRLLPQYFGGENRVVAVRDRDYTAVKNRRGLFYCDYSCAEMMIVSDDETFEKVAVNLYRGEEGYKTLRYNALASLFYLSAARKCSAEYGWNLSVSAADIDKYIRSGAYKSFSDAISFINIYNRRNPIDDSRRRTMRKIRAVSLKGYLYITNGHDFVSALKVFLSQNSSDKRLSDKTVSAALRLAYSKEAFMRSNLYGELKRYSEVTELVLV